MPSPFSVYERATDIPAWVIDTLKRHNLNANIILPQIEKSKQSPPDAPQLWIVYAPNLHLYHEETIDSRWQQVHRPNERAGGRVAQTRRPKARLFSLRPTAHHDDVYDAYIRRCTRQTFKKTQRQPVGYEWDMRLARASDRHMVAELCKGFSDESEPFFLNDEEADLEAEYLINSKLVWIYMIRESGKPNYELASIAACTRNMEKVGAITKVYTAVKWRGKGCAGQLTSYVCEKLFAAGKENLVLYVGVDNPARRVYDKIGFVGVDAEESLDRWCEIGFDQDHVDLGHW